MVITKQIKHLLAKPFPQEESIFVSFKIAAAISVFVVLFLFIFKPFGMHLLESGLFLLCLGFGIVSFLATIVYEIIVVYLLKIKGDGVNFTFSRWILYFIGVIIFISFANFIFVRIALFDDIQWSLYPYMLRGTFAIGLFPVIVVGAFALLKQEKKYQDIALELNQYSPYRNTQSNKQLIFGIQSNNIRYLEAMQNYINIIHVNSDGQLNKKVERATLKSIPKKLLGDSLTQCHRSFFVNREAIISTSGNAQGLQLSLKDCDKTIPVSRSFVSVFRQH